MRPAVARQCNAAHALPGSQPLPADVRSSIAAAGIPAQALMVKRSVCNRLVLEPGEFARQHALDAIDWRPWSPAVLEEAQRLGRPLLVFSCFSASASCATFARESLPERRLAREINTSFVPVLVDRLERPDVDAYVMQAAEVMTGSAGWPVVALLQPDGRPFEAYSWGAAGTGRKKLSRIVEEIRRRIALGGGSIEERAELAIEKMHRRAGIDTSGTLPDAVETQRALRGYLAAAFDAQSGSFGPPPLFPRAPVLDFLASLARRGDAGARTMAATVLATLRASPLADPVGGGFHRYAAGAQWQQPAFEKMLADNAAIAIAYMNAAVADDRKDIREDFLATARATVDFLLRDLRLPGGAFAVSLSAMSEDASGSPCNGCFYADGDDVRRAALASADARERAMRDRERRSTPARDELVVADANAVAISALVRAAEVFAEPRYLAAAVDAAVFLDSHVRAGGLVRHCVHAGGRPCADGYLSDHALLALAYLDLDEKAEAADVRWREGARAIAGELARRFQHEGTGGFFQTGSGGELLPLRFKPDLDTSVACGNSAAAMLYVRLAARAGDANDAGLARRTLEAFAEILVLRPLAVPSMVIALGLWSELPAGTAPDPSPKAADPSPSSPP